MSAAFDRIDRWIGAAEIGVCVGLLIVITAVTAAGVFARYVMNSPLVWGADVGSLALIWLTFVGAGALFRQNGHIAASALPQTAPYPLGAILGFVVVLAVAGTMAVVAWYGVATAVVQHGQMITTLNLPRSAYTIPIVWMAGSIGFALVARLMRRLVAAGGESGEG